MKTKVMTAAALCTVLLCSFPAFAEKGKSTKGDPSVTPWHDPQDPYVILLNKDDKNKPADMMKRNKMQDRSIRGPIDLQRYAGGHAFDGFPTYFNAPVARFPEDLKAGDIDVAVVGVTTDLNGVRGTAFGANMLRGFVSKSSYYFSPKGDGKQTRKRTKDSLTDQYVRSSLDEVNIVDYGNIKANMFSAEFSTDEMRKVLGEIHEGGAIPLMVGGSHDNIYGHLLSVADAYGRNNFCVVHFDSHIDTMSQSNYGFWVHNANGMWAGVEMGLFKGEDAVHVGLSSLAPTDAQMEWTRKNGFRYHFKAEIERDGWKTVMERVLDDVKECENLVVTIDIDVMDQVYVPGTGGREPDGPSSQEMNTLVRALAIQNNIVSFEIAEYNPMLDSRNGQTATVVRGLMDHFIWGFAARKRGITDPFYLHPLNVDDGR